MGAAASLVENADKFDTSGMKKNNNVNSSRVSHHSSGRSVNSVRAMALMNHARQENSYMSQDGLKANLKNSIRVGDGKDQRKSKKSPRPSLKASADATTAADPQQSAVQAATAAAAAAPSPSSEGVGIDVSRGMNMFRSSMGLNLKISVNDDNNDWVQVSDDDESVNLAEFDTALIEVPGEEGGSSKPIGSSGSMQYRQDGTFFVEGLKAGVGAEGIIRPNNGNNTRKLPMRERLIVLCRLGQGASSAVYKALDLTDMRLVALKMIHVTERDKRDQMVRELKALFQLLRENSRRSSIHLPKKFRRPEKYIVDFYDAFSNLEDGIVSLMIEYMDGGSLQDIVGHGGCADEPTLANIAVQALKGLDFLHEGQQIHRDLKPGNFLISHRGEVKVADLGILKQLHVEPGVPGLPRTNTYVGTATYMSPERIDGKEYSFPSDVWAFGLSLIAIATGKLPLDTSGGYWAILKNIRDAPPPSLPATFSREFRDFIAGCMKRSPDERLTVKQLLKHPFLHKTVAEDLTYNQSYNRGRDELLSIIKAIYAHVKQLKADYTEQSRSYSFSGSAVSDKVSPLRERFFGDIENRTIKETMAKLLFNEDPEPDASKSQAKPATDGNGETNTTPQRSRIRISRPRLNTLAKQLHIPIDKALREARDYLDVLQ